MIITDYQKNKENIDIAVFISRRNSLLSKAIRFITRSDWSHTGFVVKETIEGSVRSVVYEADFKTRIVQKLPASLIFAILTYKIYPIEYEDRKRIINRLQEAWGKKYDVSGALLSPICDTATKNEVYCSELVREVLQDEPAIKPFFDMIDPYLKGRGIFPDDIEKIMDAYANSKKKHL